jgi:large subunit ribosomal protein L22
MESRATVKYLRISPQKARLVVDLIRGKNAGQALGILGYARGEGRRGIRRLGHTKKRAAADVAKVLLSAISNAEEKSENVDVDELWVKEIYVNEGPRVKRVRPAPMGRAYRYQRRMSHITVVVEQAGE